ncbi:MAG: tetratricopeptide repeat protein [Candidatus Helarchaeota archaeon]
MSTKNRIKNILELSKRINDRKLEAMALKYMGIYSKINGNFKKALDFLNRALMLYEQYRNEKEVSEIFLEIGIINQNMEKWDHSINYFKDSLKINHKLNDRFKEAKLYNLIANSHKYQKNIKKSIEYYKKSLSLSETLNFKDFFEESVVNLIQIYENKKNEKEYNKFFNKLVEFNSKKANKQNKN